MSGGCASTARFPLWVCSKDQGCQLVTPESKTPKAIVAPVHQRKLCIKNFPDPFPDEKGGVGYLAASG